MTGWQAEAMWQREVNRLLMAALDETQQAAEHTRTAMRHQADALWQFLLPGTVADLEAEAR